MSSSRAKFDAWWKIERSSVECPDHTFYPCFCVWQAAEQARQAEIDALNRTVAELREVLDDGCVVQIQSMQAENAALKLDISKWRKGSDYKYKLLIQKDAEIVALKQRVADADKKVAELQQKLLKLESILLGRD